MIHTYHIINQNLSELENAINKFEELRFHIDIYREVKNEKPQNTSALQSRLSALQLYTMKCAKLNKRLSIDLERHFEFFMWKDHIESKGHEFVYDNIDFSYLKSQLIFNSKDTEFRKIIEKITPVRFNNLLKNDERFYILNGERNTSRRRFTYGKNFKESETLLMNWIIQKRIDFKAYFSRWYSTSLPTISGNLYFTLDNNQKFIDRFKEFIQSCPSEMFTSIELKNVFKKMSDILIQEISSLSSLKSEVIYLSDETVCKDLKKNKRYNIIDTSLSKFVCVGCDLYTDAKINYQIECEDGKTRLIHSKHFKRVDVLRQELLKQMISET